MSATRTVVRLRARTGATQPPHDLEAEIAADVTVGAFAAAVAKELELRGPLAAVLERTGSVLGSDQPLLQAGVRNGDTLALRPAATPTTRSRATPARRTSTWSSSAAPPRAGWSRSARAST